jgi:mannose-6-phosphate isomerase
VKGRYAAPSEQFKAFYQSEETMDTMLNVTTMDAMSAVLGAEIGAPTAPALPLRPTEAEPIGGVRTRTPGPTVGSQSAANRPPGPLPAAGSPLPRKTDKPWGHELLWVACARYAAKILHIEAGHRLSLQYHRFKEETLLLMRGRMALELEGPHGGMERHEALPGQLFHILPGQKHRLAALETCDVLEVSTPELEDVVRLQDDFGRE